MRALTALAARIGFTFSKADVDRVVDLPFGIFRQGNKRAVENVVSGTHEGVPMRLFDYWYYVSDGRSGSYRRFTCALATVAIACPELRIGHENALTRLGGDLGVRDIELEYDDFNRRFRVKCGDQKFAFSLLDGKMMQWLLDADAFQSVEIVGPWIFVVTNRMAPERWLGLGSWLQQFVHQIPPVVYSSYPPR